MAEEPDRKEYAGVVKTLLEQTKQLQEDVTPHDQEQDQSEIEELTKLIRERIQKGN